MYNVYLKKCIQVKLIYPKIISFFFFEKYYNKLFYHLYCVLDPEQNNILLFNCYPTSKFYKIIYTNKYVC